MAVLFLHGAWSVLSIGSHNAQYKFCADVNSEQKEFIKVANYRFLFENL